jgi:hypothetical protein
MWDIGRSNVSGTPLPQAIQSKIRRTCHLSLLTAGFMVMLSLSYPLLVELYGESAELSPNG